MATDDTQRDFGQYLQSHRRARGMSLEMVARLTRITPTNLQHIEGEELDKLPTAVFVKGFVRAYAEAVGADPGEALRRYTARCEKQANWARVQPQPTADHFYGRVFLALLIFALLVAGTLYVANYWTAPHNHAGPEQALPGGQASGPEGAASMSADRAFDPGPSAVPTTAVIVPEVAETVVQATETRSALSLELVSVEPTWCKIIADGGKPAEFTMQVGDKITLEAKKNFSLLIGNAGGVRIHFNGKPIQVSGKSGQVVTLQLP